MSAKNPLKKIAIEQLRPGMFVKEMDISWIDSPFVKHSRLFKTPQEIKKLVDAGVKKLVIDTSKGLDVESSVTDAPPPTSQIANPPPSEANNSGEPVSVEQELKAALNIRNKVKSVITSIHSQIEQNRPIPVEDITPLVDETMKSLERNNQALMSLVHLSRTAQKIADHCFSTFCLVLNIAVERGLKPAEQEVLGIAALLHDAGWSKLPTNLVGKRTSYTETEKKLLSAHPVIAVKLVPLTDITKCSARLLLEHHERCDGSGYPNGLSGEEIHPLSKIIAVADHYDEIVHQLQDKPGMLPNKALRVLYMEAEKGVFDMDVVASLISLLGIYPVTTAIQLNTGERGLVIDVKRDAHLKPVIKIIYDKSKRALPRPIEVDLNSQPSEGEQRSIESIIDPKNSSDDPERRLVMEL